MGKIITIVNQKGGVGKTTTAINLAASLALAEKEILRSDAAPQGNATSGLGIPRDGVERSLYDVYAGRCGIEDALQTTGVEHLSILPSTMDLLGAEIDLVGKEGRERILYSAVHSVRERYRYIFI